MRADLVLARTAVAHAAWRGGAAVEEEDIRVAAELALPHRRRRDPFDEPGVDPDQLDQALRDSAPAGSDHDPEPDPDGGGGAQAEGERAEGERAEGERAEGERAEGETSAPQRDSAPATRPSAAPGESFRTRPLRVPGVGEGSSGRRSTGRNSAGAAIRPSLDDELGHGVHLFGTVLAAAGRSTGPGPVRPDAADIRRAVRLGREGNLVVFVVDASGSMAARDRMAAVAGATLSLLRDAYQRRDTVAVITFRGSGADVVLAPTGSAYIASRRLSRFDTGGTTPLAEGLLAARDLVVRERVKDPARRPLVVVLTDGRATAGADPLARTAVAARRLAAEGIAAVVVDCETTYLRLGLAGELAAHMSAPCIRLEQLRADNLARVVRRVA